MIFRIFLIASTLVLYKNIKQLLLADNDIIAFNIVNCDIILYFLFRD